MDVFDDGSAKFGSSSGSRAAAAAAPSRLVLEDQSAGLTAPVHCSAEDIGDVSRNTTIPDEDRPSARKKERWWLAVTSAARGEDADRRGRLELGIRSNAPKDVHHHVKSVVERNKELAQPHVVRNLVVTYFASAFVVVLLSLGGQIFINAYIDNSQSDDIVINTRQRMISQLITKDGLALYHAVVQTNISNLRLSDTEFGAYLKEMGEMVPRWEMTFHGLINGSQELGLPGTKNRNILSLTARQYPYFSAMLDAAKAILAIDFTNITLESPAFEALGVEIDVLLENEAGFLSAQEEIYAEFQAEADSHLRFLVLTTWVMLGLVVLMLTLEGLLVFWPVARGMQRLIDGRFALVRRSLEMEAENQGVSVLMMGYINHELKKPMANLNKHLEEAERHMAAAEGAVGLTGGTVATGPEDEEAIQPLLGPLVEEVEAACRCCELLRTIAGDISNLRNIELGRMTLMVEVVDVSDVIQQVLSHLAPQLQPEVQLLVQVDPSLEEEHRRLDKQRLQQILLNLIDNAFRRTTEGEVIVRAAEGSSPNSVRFEVEDTGEGLTPEQQQSLYAPVVDSAGVHESTGNLALYVVKLLVQLLNGTVGVYSTLEGTSVHWVELPALSEGRPICPPDRDGGSSSKRRL